ncbi:CRISPR-associated protein Csy4 (plasmid) [Vitreoscilla filiformis]|uniref:CRISPR-associated protein Csy4 n=1 Tax=Vitreoscilla filiformis TaxID=63 RepID=A0A221KJS7_VITFI|nr:type I-F CRISPR-associated endoribonuclease Cas6/Csy4 [Vitreoscilla filiformis]ASM79266.1 CRISPR-associated protein Csy4 [Vitreoscilla filiformis]
MCTYYLDLVLEPDPEFGAPMLMAALYAKLHRALVAVESTTPLGAVGVSFPLHDDARPTLGTCMRLHGSEAALAALMSTPWLRGVRDHLAQAQPTPQPVPLEKLQGYRVVSRVQVHSSPERQRRRLMRRQGVDEREAVQRIPNDVVQRCDLPFVSLASASTGQVFKLFVRHGTLQAQAVEGRFNAYGLSQQGATVPWF